MRDKNISELSQNYILRINDKKTLQLIEEYKKEECLWNSALDDYPNKAKRMRAAEKIAKILNIKNFEGKHVLIKFKNLRNSYSQELKKIKHSLEMHGEDSPELYRPKVQWFPLMDSFIRPHLQTSRLAYSNEIQKEKNVSNVKMECYEVEDQEDWVVQPVSSEPTVSLTEYQSENDELSNHSRAKRRRRSSSSSPSDKLNQNQIFFRNDASPLATRNEDTFDAFGRYIASLLRNLPPPNALRLQPKIVDMIVEVGIKLEKDGTDVDRIGENSEID